MASSRDKRNVAVLAVCQAIFNSARSLTFLSAALVGVNMLGDDLTLVTLPITLMLVGTAGSTIPSAYLMRWIGRKWGFFIMSLIGAAGASVCVYGVNQNDFWLFNFGIFVFGLYSGAAQQYRFAVADAAPDYFKAKAISLVLAAGVVGAFVGPESAKLSKDMFDVEFAGAFTALMLFTLATGFAVLGIDIPKLSRLEYEDSGRPLGEIFKQPTAIVAVLSALFGYTAMNFLMTATPIAMKVGGGFDFNDTAFVIEWHVVGMFAPGFFTGTLINRFGVLKIIMTGSILQLLSIIVALNGDSLTYFWISLFLLGVGWNFAFTGGTRLLTQVHTPSERAKVQGTNDFVVFTGMALSALFSGTLYHNMGWTWVNYGVLPMVLIVLIATTWLSIINRREAAASDPAE